MRKPEVQMGKVIVGATLSLDGFMNDREGSLDKLYPDLEALRQSEMLRESMKNTGAALMGRRTYDLGQGDYTGYEYQVPIYVITHHPPAAPAMGQNEHLSFTFVTEGVESAVRQAKAAAGEKDVTLIGGAQIAQAILRAGLADELEIGFVPWVFGTGLRFFEAGCPPLELEQIKVQTGPGRTDIRYRIIK
jgi:dihydrofolate reductase